MSTSVTANAEFLLAEDEALKTKVSGLQLEAPRAGANGADVGVWFRWPLREYGDALFPFITIDLLDARPDTERMHSYQYDFMPYVSDSVPGDNATPVNYLAPYPIPFTLMYLVATHCRTSRHDRLLYKRLLAPDRLPRRFGVLHVPTDDTVRRLDVLDVSESNDYDSLQKRVFRRMFTIGVSAEMLPENAATYGAPSINDVIYNSTLTSDLAAGLAPPSFVIDPK